jgi:hypothetical protein
VVFLDGCWQQADHESDDKEVPRAGKSTPPQRVTRGQKKGSCVVGISEKGF